MSFHEPLLNALRMMATSASSATRASPRLRSSLKVRRDHQDRRPVRTLAVHDPAGEARRSGHRSWEGPGEEGSADPPQKTRGSLRLWPAAKTTSIRGSVLDTDKKSVLDAYLQNRSALKALQRMMTAGIANSGSKRGNARKP